MLVLDKLARDVLTPLFRVKDLRSHGVTLHLGLDADRQNIPDVPAVYLMRPTEENVARAVQDAAVGTYERIHLNFVTPLPRPLMESLAEGAVKAGCVAKIASVHDQMLGFVSLEVTTRRRCLDAPVTITLLLDLHCCPPEEERPFTSPHVTAAFGADASAHLHLCVPDHARSTRRVCVPAPAAPAC